VTEAGPTLVIIRGNSGSGKTSTAREVRRRYGQRGLAVVEQDYLRRVVLREHGSNRTPTVAPAFITTVVRAALEQGYHVVLEGILHTGSYGGPLRQLIADHAGPSFVYWLEVSFDETVRRHQQRGEATRVTEEDMRDWYAPPDLIGVPGERIITESTSMADTVDTILHASGLAQAAPLTPCPRLCPRCAEKDLSDNAGADREAAQP
jgi:predicted kinase